MMFDDPGVNDPIMEFKSQQETLMRRAEALRPVVNSCRDASERAEASAVVSIEQKTATQVKVSIIMFAKKKMDEALPLLRELAKEGLKTNKEKPYKDSGMFDFMGIREYDLGQDCSLKVMMISKEKKEDEVDTDSCRLVQVGFEEVPKYEIQCS